MPTNRFATVGGGAGMDVNLYLNMAGAGGGGMNPLGAMGAIGLGGVSGRPGPMPGHASMGNVPPPPGGGGLPSLAPRPPMGALGGAGGPGAAPGAGAGTDAGAVVVPASAAAAPPIGRPAPRYVVLLV